MTKNRLFGGFDFSQNRTTSSMLFLSFWMTLLARV
jgi:hypothetical protein